MPKDAMNGTEWRWFFDQVCAHIDCGTKRHRAPCEASGTKAEPPGKARHQKQHQGRGATSGVQEEIPTRATAFVELWASAYDKYARLSHQLVWWWPWSSAHGLATTSPWWSTPTHESGD